ncbi:serine/threonine-protein kinase [Streptomyces triticiradicis]|uniref:non-specific serine/threonine protein kinase n=1 Tax=Streptomyces triticiradicis TaxID=2651189 RepID=A0A7J5DJ33_9ACTN|nr:serine/threonine-protein kinase [Streptomyces triticiradicis]KAB1988693.1 serine/threonine protein kinase [Streptomyces triticiradicis]
MGTEGENARVIADRYRLEARIGRGGMGVVWRATDQLLGRRVAVKELALDDSLSAEESRLQRDRTLREARAVAQLHHPHIIVVHDVVEDDERPYIVMELIDGGSLAERISENGPVDAREAARIGIDLLGALRRAHEAGVLHRDLKPANVLVEAGTDRIVLTDFGIAQVAGATTLTETGSFVGSPEYTAPERMAGARTGPESDLWSLGALLCTVLSGASPFRRDSLGGILHAVVVDEIRPPAQAAPLLPVVRGLLERDPERRLDAAEAERMLRAFRDTGRTPRLLVPYTPTRRDIPHVSLRRPGPEPSSGSAAVADSPPRQSTRSLLVAAALVAAMAGAGVSAAALLMGGGGDGRPAPSSAPGTPRTPSVSSSTSSTASPASGPRSAPPTEAGPTAAVTGHRTPSARTAPSGYRIASDANGFSLAVPEGFTRDPQGERIFYMSSGDTFRIGIKVADPAPGGPLGVMRRADASGPASNPGYRDGTVARTVHDGHTAALWEFTWNGFSKAEGPRHTYDLCWEEGGRMYDVWVSAPVGRVTEAKEYFDVAVDTFAVP